MKYKIIGAIIIASITIQLIPYGKNYSNPPVLAEPKWDSPQTRELFFRVCADCHSNETKRPWYSSVAPVSWLVQHDIDDGRKHFNISVWGIQERNDGDDAAGEIEEGEMPPWFYLIPRPNARLSEEESKSLIKGLVATFGEEKESEHEREHRLKGDEHGH